MSAGVEQVNEVDSPLPENEPASVLTLIRRIQSGALSGANLSIQDRRACLEHLVGEGYSVVEVAEILDASERTLFRDRKAIQESHAVRKDPKLVEQMVGRLIQEAELAVVHIRRVVREKQTPAAVRVDGERNCWRILCELVQNLQRLGYLPMAAQQIQADLTHRLGAPPNAEAIQAELKRIQVIQRECAPVESRPEAQGSDIEGVITALLAQSSIDPNKEATDDSDP